MQDITITLTGPAGSGKTLLTRHIEAYLQGLGLQVAVAIDGGEYDRQPRAHVPSVQVIQELDPRIIIVEKQG